MSRNFGIPLRVPAMVFAGALLARAAAAQPAEPHQTITGTIYRIEARTGAIDLLTNVGHAVRVRRVSYGSGVKVKSSRKEVGAGALAVGVVCRVDCEMSSSGLAATAVEIVRPAPGKSR